MPEGGVLSGVLVRGLLIMQDAHSLTVDLRHPSFSLSLGHKPVQPAVKVVPMQEEGFCSERMRILRFLL